MRRFAAATAGWPAGAIAGVLLAAVALAGPATAASLNLNLTATAKYSASSYWDQDVNSPTFIADRAFRWRPQHSLEWGDGDRRR